MFLTEENVPIVQGNQIFYLPAYKTMEIEKLRYISFSNYGLSFSYIKNVYTTNFKAYKVYLENGLSIIIPEHVQTMYNESNIPVLDCGKILYSFKFDERMKKRKTNQDILNKKLIELIHYYNSLTIYLGKRFVPQKHEYDILMAMSMGYNPLPQFHKIANETLLQKIKLPYFIGSFISLVYGIDILEQDDTYVYFNYKNIENIDKKYINMELNNYVSIQDTKYLGNQDFVFLTTHLTTMRLVYKNGFIFLF